MPTADLAHLGDQQARSIREPAKGTPMHHQTRHDREVEQRRPRQVVDTAAADVQSLPA